jgi:hypothetical protein
MSPRVSIVAIALFALAAVAMPAGAALDDHTHEAMGGTYAVDCARADGPRVVVDKDAITVLDGAKSKVAKNIETAASWYGDGGNANEQYRVALLSRVDDDPDLVFAIYEDEKGYYGLLDNVLDGIRPEVAKLKFRQCKAAAPAKEAAKLWVKADPVGPRESEAKIMPAPPEATKALRADKNFRAAYAKAMGPAMRERWIAVLDGPFKPSQTVILEGVEYVTLTSCKMYDCGDNNLVVVWSAPKKTLYGVLRQAGENAFVGAPPVAVAEELTRLWQEAWGGGVGSTP